MFRTPRTHGIGRNVDNHSICCYLSLSVEGYIVMDITTCSNCGRHYYMKNRVTRERERCCPHCGHGNAKNWWKWTKNALTKTRGSDKGCLLIFIYFPVAILLVLAITDGALSGGLIFMLTVNVGYKLWYFNIIGNGRGR